MGGKFSAHYFRGEIILYCDFAEVYDRLMCDADYTKRTKYTLSLFKEFDRKPSLMLDLCCGTGNFSCRFAKENISVIGADISEDMLALAREKSENLDILYLCQNASELDLYGTVDGAVCLMDSLNHITDYGDFKKAVEKVALFLEKDRLFIFDLNTLYKAQSILGENTFVSEENGVFLAWQNEYDAKARINDIYLDFFIKGKDGKYTRKSENIKERVYLENEVNSALKEAGFEVLAVLDDMKKTPPTDKSQRVFYVARKL